MSLLVWNLQLTILKLCLFVAMMVQEGEDLLRERLAASAKRSYDLFVEDHSAEYSHFILLLKYQFYCFNLLVRELLLF